MAYLTSRVTFMQQATDGVMGLYTGSPGPLAGNVCVCSLDVDTRNGVVSQNHVSVRLDFGP
jgi:hypothetical protein